MIKKIFSKTVIHTILIATSLLSIFPFIWLTSTSLKGVNEDIFAYPPTIIPQDFTWMNYIEVWQKVDFMAYFWNSMIVAGLTVFVAQAYAVFHAVCFVVALHFCAEFADNGTGLDVYRICTKGQ